MSWQLFVSLRYLTSRHREKFISIISLISILGVAIGVGALIIVLAVMSGFDEELKERLIGTTSHVVIESEFGINPTPEIMSKVLGTEHVIDASFFTHGQALIRKDENVSGIVLRGVDPSAEKKVSRIGEYLKSGTLDLGADGILVGSELAGRLSLKIGDKITVITSACIEGKELKVCGIFTSGMYEYDANLAYVNMPKAQEVFGVKGLVSGIAVKVDDAFNAPLVRRALREDLDRSMTVRTWMDMNKNLMSALKLEKTVMFIILTLIVMVACFNIASTLIMTVLEKTKDIGILKAIGAKDSDIMAIFAMQGGMIGFLGTITGALFGMGMCWLLKTYQFINLPQDIYYIDKLPVRLEPMDILLVVASGMVISLLATIYPSYKASRLDPVESLRYE
ncbi:MAG: lipoprotein-releasing ABC transporter permease subunit [Candidatus Omnitrophota bacterium]|jgi:lipoprotein-releasing system permease protein